LAAGFLEPLATLVQTGLKLQLLRSYMERINDVLDAPREQEGQTVATAPRLTGRIRADGVWFAYGGPLAPPVVKDVSLEVQPGQLLGIVGRSGSGKSTFAHLLLGIYPPTSGRILFDGRDLAEFELRSLRGQIGIVTQRPYLFGATIRQNIALSNPAMPLEAVVEAAKLACIHDDIVAMPMGYETPLVDGGASLSGGQQQRIALARALAHRPTILLLDEATSDLDGVTERMVHHNLSALGCTRIVIAHRLSTIVDADLILVMEEGTIVQQGTHDELMVLPGAYRQQVLVQQGPQRLAIAAGPPDAANAPQPAPRLSSEESLWEVDTGTAPARVAPEPAHQGAAPLPPVPPGTEAPRDRPRHPSRRVLAEVAGALVLAVVAGLGGIAIGRGSQPADGTGGSAIHPSPPPSVTTAPSQAPAASCLSALDSADDAISYLIGNIRDERLSRSIRRYEIDRRACRERMR
jgi:ABC-type methionine transport system ATPase subunit